MTTTPHLEEIVEYLTNKRGFTIDGAYKCARIFLETMEFVKMNALTAAAEAGKQYETRKIIYHMTAPTQAQIEALKPFAKASEFTEGDEADDYSLANSSARHKLTIGDLRKASIAITAAAEAGERKPHGQTSGIDPTIRNVIAATIERCEQKLIELSKRNYANGKEALVAAAAIIRAMKEDQPEDNNRRILAGLE